MRELLTVSPARRDHLPAGRIALGVAVPLGLLLWLGRIDLTIYAAFGAFTGIYARHEPFGSRLAHQLESAVLLVACVALGLGLSHGGAGPWVMVGAGSVVAASGAVLAALLRLRPAGSLFFIFATTAIASIPQAAPFGLGVGVAAASAGFSVLLGVLGALFSERLRPGELAPPPPDPLEGTELALHGLRYLVAAALAGALGLLSSFGHSYWAMVAAAAPLALSGHRARVQRAIHRIVGTLGGVGVTAFLLAFGLRPWQTALLVVVLQFLAELFVGRNYSLALLFITPLALLMSQLAHPVEVADLLTARAVETVIGAAVGLLVVVVLRSPEGRQETGPPRPPTPEDEEETG
ncbi:hypothetical protein DEIPH_ctg004orf0098 [Deinococcus phoenicis]|uniref:Integral membrane bound transporter domain-containing protein n=1 Tax=Deinococcus phoenicis TaxID=1476583 RepID=A0A016QUZ1_9DEIO|nr:hypothetical protein DEIPH_ctg004orf0098 [Deinococcus phoenicis]